MMMYTPRRTSPSCGPLGAPPYRQTEFMPRQRPNLTHSSWICVASSRVGAITSVVGPCRGSFRSCMMRRKAGTRKPSVLPDPVLATPTTSKPRIAGAQLAAWIGVGPVKPACVNCCRICGGNRADSYDVYGSGHPCESVTSFFLHQPVMSSLRAESS